MKSKFNSLVLVLTLVSCFSISSTISVPNHNKTLTYFSVPVFDPVDDIQILSNTTQTIAIHAENTNQISTLGQVPFFVTIQNSGNGNALLTISPTNTDIGTHTFLLVAVNSSGSASLIISVEVISDGSTPFNPPAFDAVNDINMQVDEHQVISLHASFTDQITQWGSLPSFMTLIDNGNGNATININPDSNDEGTYTIKFKATGSDGTDILTIVVNILATPIVNNNNSCFITNYEIVSSSPGFENLFDEFDLSGDPTTGPGGNPLTKWSPSWNEDDYPHQGYIDFGTPTEIQSIFIRDVNGEGDFFIYTGINANQPNVNPLIQEGLNGYNVWNEHEVNITTQYLFFEMGSPIALVSEILFYGGCNTPTTNPVVDSIAPNPIANLNIESTTSKSIQLSWSASGDDGMIGKASKYDVRYSSEYINENNFDDLPSMIIENFQLEDSIITYTINDLNCDKSYHFAVKAIDDAGQHSSLSNIAEDKTSPCNTDITVTITFDGSLQNVPDVNFAKLRYNKDFAYSLTIDDGGVWEKNVVYPILNGGTTPDGQTHDGFFYTDGCGNHQPFHPAFSIMGDHIVDENAPQNSFLSWSQVNFLFNAGWDLLNHSFTHNCTYNCNNYNGEIVNNTNIIKDKVGFTTTHFAIPSGDDEGYTQPAFQNGMIAVYDQNYQFSGFNGMKIDEPINLYQFKMWRNSLEFEDLPLGEDIDNIASMSNNGNKYWYSEYAHRIGYLGEPWVGILASDFKNYMTHIENTYGRYGSDRVWVAGVQEVYEYLTIRENAQLVATEIDGNQLRLELDLSNVPDNLRRNALTLLVNQNGSLNITNISTSNANVTYNSNGLINLDW